MWPERRPQSPTSDPANERGEPAAGLLKRVQWTIMRPLASYLGGDERSLVRGPGVELSEVREYQPGDDVRHIDWNITARSENPYVRESRVERAVDVWLVLDVSGSVDWGTAECLKRDRAVEFAAVAGQLLGRHGNRVGALLFADRPLCFFPPAAGRTHHLRLLAGIREEPRQTRRAPTDLRAALTRANAVMRRGALVLVVSDFLVQDGWQAALSTLAQRHEVVGVRLCDPREAELPDVGLVTLEDPETGSQFVVDTRDRALRERFQAAAAAQSEQIRADLARCGVDQLVVSTGEALLPVLIRFLNARRLRRVIRVGGGSRLASRSQPGRRAS